MHVVLHKSKRRDEQTTENCRCKQCALLINEKSVGNVPYLRILTECIHSALLAPPFFRYTVGKLSVS